jgi:hypothetical protein
MLLLDAPFWPQRADLGLNVSRSMWEGLDCGHGRLSSRRLEVTSSGRRAAARERRLSLWLPSPDGETDPVGRGGRGVGDRDVGDRDVGDRDAAILAGTPATG